MPPILRFFRRDLALKHQADEPGLAIEIEFDEDPCLLDLQFSPRTGSSILESEFENIVLVALLLWQPFEEDIRAVMGATGPAEAHHDVLDDTLDRDAAVQFKFKVPISAADTTVVVQLTSL